MINKVLYMQDIKLHHMASTCTFPLFWYGDRLFRSCIPNEEERFKKILSLNIPEIQEAIETEFKVDLSEIADLIDKSRTNDLDDWDQLVGIAPVYEHKVYDHRVRIQETYPLMIKKFISTFCQMNIKLLEHGFIAIDAHEANINMTIDGIKWLDYGSIKPISKDDYLCLRSFVEVGYLIGRYLLNTFNDLQERCSIDYIKLFNEEMAKLTDLDFSQPESWTKVIEYVDSIPIPDLKSTHWADEYTLESNINDPSSRNTKGQNYWNLLQEIEFDTITDVGCNKGYFGFLAAKKAKSMIGFDVDVKCIYRAYELNETFKLPAVFAVKTIEEMIANENFESDRYKSDLVVVLAMVHHLKIQKIPEKDIVRMIDGLCKRYVILEDIDDAKGYEEIFIRYGYELVKRVDSSPLPRSLSLYRKI